MPYIICDKKKEKKKRLICKYGQTESKVSQFHNFARLVLCGLALLPNNTTQWILTSKRNECCFVSGSYCLVTVYPGLPILTAEVVKTVKKMAAKKM